MFPMRIAAPLLVLTLGAAQSVLAASYVANPSFESNYNPTFPSYGPIDSWSGGSGVNQKNGPFHNGGTPIPDQARVAFMQGSGTLKQSISGLTAGENYWVQFFYDARGCCGGTIDIATKFGGADLDRIVNVRPVTGGKSYEFRNVSFVPEGDTGDLSFVAAAAGDATALIDSVSIVQRGTNDIVVMNPSFEASGVVADPGYINPPEAGTANALAGWTAEGLVGVNVNGIGAFANNGTNPDQDSVAFIEGVGALIQRIPNLQPGTKYDLSLAVNASSGSAPHLRISVDGEPILDADLSAVGDGPYVVKTASFTPASPTAELRIEQTLDGNVLLLDDVRIQGAVVVPLDPIRFSPGAAELFPGQTAEFSLSVDPRLLESGPAKIVLRIPNQNVARFVGGEADGRFTLNFAKGGSPSQSFTVQAQARGSVRVDLVENAEQKVANDVTINVVTSFVRNPSFEETTAGAFPGYGPILAWNTVGNAGLNNASGPFHDNGRIPDRRQVAFLQGSAKLSQQILGLEAGKNYWLQFAYNSRNCCGDHSLDLAVNFGGTQISKIEGITPVGNGDYSLHSVAFTPASSSGLLEFVSTATGDATALIDAVNIIQRGTDEAVVFNPSFEAEGSPSGVGYIQPDRILGWQAGGGYGVNITGVGPFSDNGTGPDQDRVLLLQNNTAFIAQTIKDLSPGEFYTLQVHLNARACCGSEATAYQLVVNGEVVTEGEMRPVGAARRYRVVRAVFVPTDVTAEIRIKHTTPTGDHTLLVDQVRVLKGDVASPVELGGGRTGPDTARVTWPAVEGEGMVLQSAPSLDGPWTDVTTPASVDGDLLYVEESTASGTKFYRLVK